MAGSVLAAPYVRSMEVEEGPLKDYHPPHRLLSGNKAHMGPEYGQTPSDSQLRAATGWPMFKPEESLYTLHHMAASRK